jgi:hypothetical protein
MSLDKLLPELLRLNHDEMVRAIDILQQQIKMHDAAQTVDSAAYEVWSPTITPETAGILQEVLKEAKEGHG